MIHPKRRHLQALITSKTEHPFDVENYLPLKEAFAAVPCDNAVMAFLLNRAVGENSKLAERLGKLGFRSFKPLAAGNHSYVLQVPGEVYLAGDHLHMGMQVIRFSNGQEKPRALALEQIQPVPTQSKVPIDPDSPTNKMYYDLLPMIPHEATAEQLEAFHADAHEKYGMPEHHVNEVDIKPKSGVKTQATPNGNTIPSAIGAML